MPARLPAGSVGAMNTNRIIAIVLLLALLGLVWIIDGTVVFLIVVVMIAGRLAAYFAGGW